MIKKELPLLVMIGRTNVGKSTLFNRLLEENKAIVSPLENTTRDFNYQIINWRGQDFQVVDTAGVIDTKNLKRKINQESLGLDRLENQIQKQVYDLIKRADLLFFLVDNKAGVLVEDKNIAKFLKKRNYHKKTIVVANKVDNFNQRLEASCFNQLSLGEPFLVSAHTGSGTGDLLDLAVNFFKHHKIKGQKKEIDQEKINLCILGQPNVGKSSLLNSILGYERVIVSEIPHTTREPQNTEILYQEKTINIIDTAGISRKGQKSKGLERPGIIKTQQVLKKSDIVLLVIDLSQDLTKQDSRLVEEIVKLGKGFIIIANKWDIVEDRDTKAWTRKINQQFPFVLWAPILFVSATTGEKVKKVLDLVLEIDQARKMKINETALDRFLLKMIKTHKPSKGKGVKHPRIYSLKQIWTNPPRFEVKIGAEEDLHKSYLRFLENRIREKFIFTGVPVQVKLKKRKRIHGQANDIY